MGIQNIMFQQELHSRANQEVIWNCDKNNKNASPQKNGHELKDNLRGLGLNVFKRT